MSANAIEDKIVEILAADSSLDEIAHFAKGFLYRIPDGWVPLCEVVIWEEAQTDEFTSNVDIVTYQGEVRFDVRLAEDVTTAGRISTVTSSRKVRDYVLAARRILRDPANIKLQNLTFTNGAVRRVYVSRNATYGVDARAAREDDYQLSGRLPIAVETQEQNA